jgi:hypothetical protein
MIGPRVKEGIKIHIPGFQCMLRLWSSVSSRYEMSGG